MCVVQSPRRVEGMKEFSAHYLIAAFQGSTHDQTGGFEASLESRSIARVQEPRAPFTILLNQPNILFSAKEKNLSLRGNSRPGTLHPGIAEPSFRRHPV